MARTGWVRRTREDRVQLVDEAPPALPVDSALLRLAAEAVILQDEAEAVLAAVARHDHLGVVAPRGGPLIQRFFGLRDELPPRCGDAVLDRLRADLDTILHHHALQVATALEFLAVDGWSARSVEHVSSFTGLGASADRLEEVYRQLAARGPG